VWKMQRPDSRTQVPHMDPVSKVVSTPGLNPKAYSCGINLIALMWGAESGMCVDIMVSPSLPSWTSML